MNHGVDWYVYSLFLLLLVGKIRENCSCFKSWSRTHGTRTNELWRWSKEAYVHRRLRASRQVRFWREEQEWGWHRTFLPQWRRRSGSTRGEQFRTRDSSRRGTTRAPTASRTTSRPSTGPLSCQPTCPPLTTISIDFRTKRRARDSHSNGSRARTSRQALCTEVNPHSWLTIFWADPRETPLGLQSDKKCKKTSTGQGKTGQGKKCQRRPGTDICGRGERGITRLSIPETDLSPTLRTDLRPTDTGEALVQPESPQHVAIFHSTESGSLIPAIPLL